MFSEPNQLWLLISIFFFFFLEICFKSCESTHEHNSQLVSSPYGAVFDTQNIDFEQSTTLWQDFWQDSWVKLCLKSQSSLAVRSIPVGLGQETSETITTQITIMYVCVSCWLPPSVCATRSSCHLRAAEVWRPWQPTCMCVCMCVSLLSWSHCEPSTWQSGRLPGWGTPTPRFYKHS